MLTSRSYGGTARDVGAVQQDAALRRLLEARRSCAGRWSCPTPTAPASRRTRPAGCRGRPRPRRPCRRSACERRPAGRRPPRPRSTPHVRLGCRARHRHLRSVLSAGDRALPSAANGSGGRPVSQGMKGPNRSASRGPVPQVRGHLMVAGAGPRGHTRSGLPAPEPASSAHRPQLFSTEGSEMGVPLWPGLPGAAPGGSSATGGPSSARSVRGSSRSSSARSPRSSPGVALASITAHPEAAPQPVHPASRRRPACGGPSSARSAPGSGPAAPPGVFEITRGANRASSTRTSSSASSPTFSSSLCLAALARLAAAVFGLPSISFLQFVTISVVGGALGSAIILVLTIGPLGRCRSRRGYDLDTVSTPLVTASGDMVTHPDACSWPRSSPVCRLAERDRRGACASCVCLYATVRGVTDRPAAGPPGHPGDGRRDRC